MKIIKAATLEDLDRLVDKEKEIARFVIPQARISFSSRPYIVFSDEPKNPPTIFSLSKDLLVYVTIDIALSEEKREVDTLPQVKRFEI